MTQPAVSVVVVSRRRPVALRRCLLGLLQLQYPMFEIVVVADPAGARAVEAMALTDVIKLVTFDQPNISEARNIGISYAAGEIVAFIDDDAIAEPSWLRFLVVPFERNEVAAVGGFVRGRNGISYQWTARTLDRYGYTTPLEVELDRPTIQPPIANRVLKTEGTNMAVRREVLVEMDGFDPGFAFFLDDTDLNLRLAQAGYATAIVPMAEVHHGFAAGPNRRADRVPRDLFDIGASWAVFQRKYLPENERRDHWRALHATERKRALRHMVAGRLEPRDLRRLLWRLDHGYQQGMERPRGGGRIAGNADSEFRPVLSPARKSVVLSGRSWQRKRLRAQAARQVESGEIVTLILLSPTSLYHHLDFREDGFWEQSGGLFGRSNRNAPIFVVNRFATRIAQEVQRVAKQRLVKREFDASGSQFCPY